MTKIKNILALALVLAVTNIQAGIKEIGVINGVHIVRVKTLGLFVPSTSTLISYDPTAVGQIEVLTHADGPGIVPAVATAGGVVGGAALLRPSKTNIKNEGSSASGGSATGGSSTATGGTSVATGGTSSSNSSSHSNSHSNSNASSNSASVSVATGGNGGNGGSNCAPPQNNCQNPHNSNHGNNHGHGHND